MISACNVEDYEYRQVKRLSVEIERIYNTHKTGLDCVGYSDGAIQFLAKKSIKGVPVHVVFGRNKHHRITTIQGKHCLWVIDNRYPGKPHCRDWYTHYRTMIYKDR